MAELRYRLVIDGTQTSGDFTDPDPTRDSGDVTIASLTGLAKMQLNVAATSTLDLDSALERAGVLKVQFLAIYSPTALFISREGTASEEWELAAGGWFMVHLTTNITDDIKIRNATGAAVVAEVYLGGLVV
mgnify:CR=1 FL=1|jgi:hypothetical protein